MQPQFVYEVDSRCGDTTRIGLNGGVTTACGCPYPGNGWQIPKAVAFYKRVRYI